jgi:transcription termination factor Rho
MQAMWTIRKALSGQPVAEVTENLITKIISSKNNEEMVEQITKAF